MKRYDVSEIGLALLLGSLMGFVPLVMMKLAPTDHVLIMRLSFYPPLRCCLGWR
jgi:hypothetical protein